jgi:hypothetical protein
MTQNTILVQQAISTFQTQIDLFDKCLHSANRQHEKRAELLELANCKGISLQALMEEVEKLERELEKLSKLSQKIKEKSRNGEIALLEIVKFSFLVKVVVDTYGYLISPKTISGLTTACVIFYKKNKDITIAEGSKKDVVYILLESSKHELNALLKASLQVNAFSKSEISAFDLGDITPEVSEDVLIFLSTKTKWEPVYKRLAAI